MSVRESVLGTLKDGREVKRYTITNQHGTEASFTNLGAIWLTMLVRDKDGKMRDVVLGVDQAAGVDVDRLGQRLALACAQRTVLAEEGRHHRSGGR